MQRMNERIVQTTVGRKQKKTGFSCKEDKGGGREGDKLEKTERQRGGEKIK